MAPSSSVAATEEDLRAYATERMEHLAVPGVAIGVHMPGHEPLRMGLGITNSRAPLAVDGDHTLFQIGSTTKTFTALAVVILVDRGLVSLDTKLVDLCPDFALPSGEQGSVCVRHLLNHTGGWDGDVLLVEPVGGRNDSALADLPGYMESSVEQLTSVKQPLLSPPPPRLQAD